MNKEIIYINNIEIIIEKKKIKNMYIHVYPDRTVKITASTSFSNEEIKKFAENNIKWINKKREYNKNIHQKPCLKYKSGETHYLWGKKYTLKLCSKQLSKEIIIDEYNNIIYLPTTKSSNIQEREKCLTEFYRKEIKEKTPEILDKCIKIVGKSPDEWRIKNMKTRWGSCNIKHKRIWLNLQLAKKPLKCLEYVIIHELTHLYEANHSLRFKKYLDDFCPKWREIEKKLNENQ